MTSITTYKDKVKKIFYL